MKKLFYILCFVLILACQASAEVLIDDEHFPDDEFRNYVITNCDTTKDRILDDSEISKILKIIFSDNYKKIKNLKGIEYFIYLTELDCNNKQIIELDLSSNTALVKLDCSNNQLTKLDISTCTALVDINCIRNELTELDVGNCPALVKLDCSGNKLIKLDVSYNHSLTELYCADNQLAKLYVSENPALTDLNCSNNQLTALQVSANNTLKVLNCTNNQLAKLYVKKNTALEILECGNNQLAKLDLSDNEALSQLRCYENSLSDLYVKENAALKTLNCRDNQLMDIDLTSNAILSNLDCRNNQIMDIDLSKNTALETFYCDGNSLLTIDLSRNTALKNFTCDSQKFDCYLKSQTFDFNNLLPYEKISKIKASSVKGLNKLNVETGKTNYDSSTGIAVFDNPPDIIRYDYPTGYKSTVLSVNLIIISSAGLKITTLEPDVIPAGEKYRFRFQASGLRPITCTVKGKLMKNLAFSDNGLLSGVAPKAGKSTMTFQASNAYSSEAKAFTITALIPPAITTSSLKEGTIGKTYSLNLGRKGGKPLTWFMDGKLPDGVAFDAVKGAIKGTPAKKGIYRLRFTLSNPAGDIEKSLILQVKAIAPKIKGTLKKGTEGKEYKSVFTVTGTKPITMTYSGTLPKGLSFDASTYTFYGTPEEVCKDREIIVTASNIESSTTVKYPLTISGVAPKFVTASLPAGTAGLEYSSDVVITGTAPITVTADGLPDGVTVNPNTGYISGTPQKLGIYNVKLTATNSIKSVNKTLKMTITAPPIFEDETLKNAIAGVAYSHKFTINSLETVKQLSITSGVLPKGISSTASFLPANLLKQGRLISLC